MNEERGKKGKKKSETTHLTIGSERLEFSSVPVRDNIRQDAAVPLPDAIPYPAEPLQPTEWEVVRPPYRLRALRHGCYLIRYTPLSGLLFHYDGTLRVQRDGVNTIASGDLYYHRQWWLPGQPPPVEPNPAAGIPIFPRSRYSYYIRVTRILEWITLTNSFTLGFELYQFNRTNNTWSNAGSYTALMTWTTAPAGYPASSDYLTGQVKNYAGTVVGDLTMGWISPYLRRAVVEIDKVNLSEWPLDNGAAVTWRTIFDLIGWDVTVVQSKSNVPEPGGSGWSDTELHAGMLQWRDSANLDTEWRYHLMAVRELDSTSRGIMYDAYGGDSNNIPREGAAISSHWVFPNSDPWGKCKGMRFGTATGPYFRTAVHEIGHAMLLYHPFSTAGNEIMQVTPQIAANAIAPTQFPDNIEWRFAPQDQMLLRHLPDMAVRPGGVPFGVSYSSVPMSPEDLVAEAEGLQLDVSPLLDVVPIGAPVRINYSIVNECEASVTVPANLSMKTGLVRGLVIDPSGSGRSFTTILRHLDEINLRKLKPGERISHSLTLLRGGQGGLFPAPGIFRIVVEVTWSVNGHSVRLTGETSVMISSPENQAHARAAYKILTTPDNLLTLVIGGDHLKDGVESIQSALDNSVLRPHFAFIEAKRLGRRFGKRRPDLKAVAALIDKTTVMSPAEIRRAAQLVRDSAKETPADTVKALVKTLQSKARAITADDETVAVVKDL